MTKATDKELGQLHKYVASAFLQALAAKEDALALLTEHGDDLPANVVLFLTKYAQTNPALLSAAVKFLKDNDITCAVADDETMSALEKTLNGKRKITDTGVSKDTTFN